jgi:methylenetetrahydrofolate dehydrogenase (NADP+) / methenyltetrahydrofolate cyclohydrolase
MTARILDGKALAGTIRGELGGLVAAHVAAGHLPPGLTAILVGEDPASQVYVRNKHRACSEVGMAGTVLRLPATTTTDQLLVAIDRLNGDRATHGILVQLPLPRAIDARRVLDAIDPRKDVDGFHPVNVGLLSQGRPRLVPCTPLGVIELLHRHQIDVRGKHCVVVGRSDIVGKPMAQLLVQRDSPVASTTCNATVTIAHSGTRELKELTRLADVLIAAVGQPEMITGDMIRPGAVVIDVGINRVGDRLVGDVHFDQALSVASAITPVPGGIGPLTIAMLLKNTLLAAGVAQAR